MQPKTKTVLFISLSFILGIICGLFLKDHITGINPHYRGRGPADFVKVLTEKLRLNEEQVVKVDSILNSNMKIMEKFKKQTMTMRDSTRMQIRKILTGEQIKLFDEFNHEHDKREEKRRE